MASISIKGVLIGAVFDIVASAIVGAIALLGLALWSGADSADEIVGLADAGLGAALSVILGGGVSVAAGYIAARIAGRGELLNGALSSFLCVSIGIYHNLTGTPTGPDTLSIAGLVVSPLLGALGGFLRLRQVADKTSLQT
jgi:hypothetical protein